MNKTKRIAFKLLSLVIGLPVTIIGIILIPLPGPGVLITLCGLFILSRGFDVVKRPFETYKQKLIDIYRRAKDRHDRFIDKHNLND